MERLNFSERASTAHKAIVVSFDLADFSDFCNQPDASVAAPRLIKNTFDLLNVLLGDKHPADIALVSEDGQKLVVPDHIKFTGDGALLIWQLPLGNDFPQWVCNRVVSTMRDFQEKLTTFLPRWEKEWRVNKLPRRLRVGIASGVVYALREPHVVTGWTEPTEYVGYCINLAVRLQNHCHAVGFLVHGVLHPEIKGMMRTQTLPMKGTQSEPVFLFDKDAKRISHADFQEYFIPQPGE